jgi:hypothetical protein
VPNSIEPEVPAGLRDKYPFKHTRALRHQPGLLRSFIRHCRFLYSSAMDFTYADINQLRQVYPVIPAGQN